MPGHVRSNNGPEFIAKAVRDWITAVGARTAIIEPGSPWENGYCESFNSKLRDELLNGEIFYTLAEAKIIVESWRRHFNTVRPHGSLGYEPPAPEVPAKAEAEVRVIGEALGLYILAEQNGALLVIDKHAAHERILFDRLKARGGQMMSQTLLVPVPVHPGAEGGELLEQNAALIAALGFQAEPYGAEAWILRAVPDGVDAADAAAALEETLDTLRKNRRLSPDALRDEALKTVACRAAVKAGRSSQPEELLALARAVCSGEVRYCPHGRPVSWTLTRQDLDRQFRRIV